MKVKVYKTRPLRLLEFWIAPVLIIALITSFIYADFINKAPMNTVKLILYIGVCLLFTGPFIYLYINHFKETRITKLTFTESNMTFQKGNDMYTIPYTDIIEVIEYSLNKYGTSKLMWSDIIKWEIKTDTAEFFISSLLISKKNLQQFIKKDIEFKATYFPTL